MTEVAFHFNVPDRSAYACRLLRKAVRQGRRIVVTAPAALLGQLDRMLWSFEPTEFLPHVLLRDGETPPERQRATPVWLCEDPVASGLHDVLVNMGTEVAAPKGFESFERLIEIVSTDDADRDAARERWKHYASRGYPIVRLEVAA